MNLKLMFCYFISNIISDRNENATLWLDLINNNNYIHKKLNMKCSTWFRYSKWLDFQNGLDIQHRVDFKMVSRVTDGTICNLYSQNLWTLIL